MWNYLPYDVRHITNYSFFISGFKHLMFEKINTSFVSRDCCSCFFLNVCVVIHHNHIINGWWELKYILGGNYKQMRSNGACLASHIYIFIFQ